jgi:two-component system cell cycle response regulator
MAVLFVDPDMEGARRLASSIASTCMVAVVPSARDALAAMRIRLPDLIVTEIDLPDVSGMELVARVRGTPATRHALLMVVTGRASVADKVAAFQAGADDYLVKPVATDLFATHMRLISRFRKILQ